MALTLLLRLRHQGLLCLAFVLLTACSKPSAGPELPQKPAWEQPSENGLYTARIEPKNSRIPIGEYHEWTLSVHDERGQPVKAATIAVTGGMPSHGHGMSSQPEVSDYLGDGRYLVEGMRFNMAGAWVINCRIASPLGTDQVQFAVELDF